MGIPAVAFSLNSSKFSQYGKTTERATWLILQYLLKNPPTKPILWNVNIPAVAPDEIRGHKITRLGRRHHAQNIIPTRDPRGENIYWIGPVGDLLDSEDGTDFAACEEGFVSITPLQVDLTGYAQMNELHDFWRVLSFKD